MIILLTLVLFHLLVLFLAKNAERISIYGYLMIGIVTLVQVFVFVALLYTMDVPTP